MKKWTRYFILHKAVRWVILQVFFVTMIFTLVSSIAAIDQRNASKAETEAAEQGYRYVLTCEITNISDYTVNDKPCYLIESDGKFVLLDKEVPLRGTLRKGKEMTAFIKYSTPTHVQLGELDTTAGLLNAHSALTNRPAMKIIWYITCGAFVVAMLVCIITLTVVDIQEQRKAADKAKNKGYNNPKKKEKQP